MTTDQDTSTHQDTGEGPKRQTAYCGHPECQQAVQEWIDAGRPDVPAEYGGGPVMTHPSEVLFYARRDWLADTYETAVAEGLPHTAEQRGAYLMRERTQRARERSAARRRGRQRPTAEAGATDER